MITELNRILFAEDSENDAELTLRALKRSGLANEVVWVRDGSLALDYLHTRDTFAARQPGNPCLVLLDLKMPKVNGLDVLRQIKADPALKTIPVVVLTSSSEEQDLVRSYEIGVNAYVVKPVVFEDFLHAVRDLGQFWAVINQPPVRQHSRSANDDDAK
jgi:CheY-like chemotaxis protein